MSRIGSRVLGIGLRVRNLKVKLWAPRFQVPVFEFRGYDEGFGAIGVGG